MTRLFTATVLGASLFSVACDDSDDDTSSQWTCPEPTEACMDEENYQQCLDVTATCEGEILIMESCPLQFGCDD